MAFDGMKVWINSSYDKPLVLGHDQQDGESKTVAEITQQATYEALGWKFGNDDDNPWKWGGTEYPLPILYWQTTVPTFPDHLK
jgi:hypothetical protein